MNHYDLLITFIYFFLSVNYYFAFKITWIEYYRDFFYTVASRCFLPFIRSTKLIILPLVKNKSVKDNTLSTKLYSFQVKNVYEDKTDSNSPHLKSNQNGIYTSWF